MIKTCPFCKAVYETKFPNKEEAFKTMDMMAREQFLSGCCSNECWDNTFSPDGEEKYDAPWDVPEDPPF